MGEKLIYEALAFARNPDLLTTEERMWLVKQAADADDETRRCAMTASEYGWDLMLGSLIRKGALTVAGEIVAFTPMGPSEVCLAHQWLTYQR